MERFLRRPEADPARRECEIAQLVRSAAGSNHQGIIMRRGGQHFAPTSARRIDLSEGRLVRGRSKADARMMLASSPKVGPYTTLNDDHQRSDRGLAVVSAVRWHSTAFLRHSRAGSVSWTIHSIRLWAAYVSTKHG
jgi:hypothetical protein